MPIPRPLNFAKTLFYTPTADTKIKNVIARPISVVGQAGDGFPIIDKDRPTNPPPTLLYDLKIPRSGRTIIWGLGKYHIRERIRIMRNLRRDLWILMVKTHPLITSAKNGVDKLRLRVYRIIAANYR